MGDKSKSSNMLLVDVPDDVKEIIEGYKKKKNDDCGCKVGNSQAVFNMLRKYRILNNVGKLQNATGTNP